MSNTPHTLREEFPDKMDVIHALKTADPRFARILEEYDEVNDKVHRAESRIDAVSDEAEAGFRKRRLELKDRIAAAIAGK